jgi:hypothetical protein
MTVEEREIEAGGKYFPGSLSVEFLLFDIKGEGVRPCNLRRTAMSRLSKQWPEAMGWQLRRVVDYVYNRNHESGKL